MPGQGLSWERRERVLERVGEVGLEAAAAEAGVQPGTVERWLARARVRAREKAAVSGDDSVSVGGSVSAEMVEGEDSPSEGSPSGSAGFPEAESDVDGQLRRTAQAARNAVERAIGRLEEILPTARNVQAISVAAGVLTDKAERLETILRESDERHLRLAENHAHMLLEVIRALLSAAGVPDTDASRGIVRELLTQASNGGVVGVSPAYAEEMRRSVRARVERELDRALPAAPAEEPSAEPVESASEICSSDSGETDPEPAEEVVADAEVVNESEPMSDAQEVARRVSEKLAAERSASDPFGVRGPSRWSEFDTGARGR